MEYVLYLSLAMLVVALTATKELLTLRVRILLAALVFGAPAAQAAGDARLSYPFQSWTMYANASPPLNYLQVIVTNDGGQAPLRAFESLLLWSPGPLRGYSAMNPLLMRMWNLQVQCRCGRNNETLDAVFEALAAIHQEETGQTVRAAKMQMVSISQLGRPPDVAYELYSWTPPR